MFQIRKDLVAVQLASALAPQVMGSAIVCVIPGAGVGLGCDVAEKLGVPIEVISVRTVFARGYLWQPIGAVTERGISAPEPGYELSLENSSQALLIERKAEEASTERWHTFGFLKSVPVKGKTVVLMDDGQALISTLLAVTKELKDRGAGKVLVSAPALDQETISLIEMAADAVIVLREMPHASFAVDYPSELPALPLASVMSA